MAPTIDSLATKYHGKVKVGKLNTDDHGDIAGRYNVMSIPTLLIFKQGAVVDTIVGAQSLPVLQQRLSRWV